MSSTPYSDTLPCAYYTPDGGQKQGRTDGNLDSHGRVRVYPKVWKKIDGEWEYQQQYKKEIRVPADCVVARVGS